MGGGWAELTGGSTGGVPSRTGETLKRRRESVYVGWSRSRVPVNLLGSSGVRLLPPRDTFVELFGTVT